jgi:hypothetical protein
MIVALHVHAKLPIFWVSDVAELWFPFVGRPLRVVLHKAAFGVLWYSVQSCML